MYKEKYLKYKTKYTTLKKQLGGAYGPYWKISQVEVNKIKEELDDFIKLNSSLSTIPFEFTYVKKNETTTTNTFKSTFLQTKESDDYYLKITNPEKRISLFIYFNKPTETNETFIIHGLTATDKKLNLFIGNDTTYSINPEILKNQDLRLVIDLIKVGSMKLRTLQLETRWHHEISYKKLVALREILNTVNTAQYTYI
jgi:hypothetical protein